jgi:hypothetical protein
MNSKPRIFCLVICTLTILLSGCASATNLSKPTKAKFTLNIGGKACKFVDGGTARIQNRVLYITHRSVRTPSSSKPRTVIKVHFADKARAAEAPFDSIEITLPRLSGGNKERLVKQYEGKIRGKKPTGAVWLTDRAGKVVSRWNIYGWHIEKFDFPTLDSKDNSQLIQNVVIRTEKISRQK